MSVTRCQRLLKGWDPHCGVPKEEKRGQMTHMQVDDLLPRLLLALAQAKNQSFSGAGVEGYRGVNDDIVLACYLA